MTKTTILMLLAHLFACADAYAQQPAYTYYSIREGLPSNDIYNCIEDRNGFLWIATENGVSKFDGKNFKNYSIVRGLPDNDVFNIQEDSSGTIWVMPFQRPPAYYDKKQDRFINSKSDKELGKIQLGAVNNMLALRYGGMSFSDGYISGFIYRDYKCIPLISANKSKKSVASLIIESDKNTFLIVSTDSVRLFKNGKQIRSENFDQKIGTPFYLNGNIYFSDSVKLKKIRLLADGSIGKIQENELPFVITALNFTGKQLAISSRNGNIYFADTVTLAFNQQSLSLNALVRSVCEDKAGNVWISTKESGLIRYRQKGIVTITEPGMQRNFTALAFKNNELIAGTNEGSLFYYSGPYNFKEKILGAQKNYGAWIKKIIVSKEDLFISSEDAQSFNVSATTEKFKILKGANKAIFLVNDTLMITGSSTAVKKVNLLTGAISAGRNVRVTALSGSSPESIFVGSPEGLYVWKNNDPLFFTGKDYPVLATRISALEYNKADDILWVGLAADTLVAMYHNKPIAVIPMAGALPGNISRCLWSKQKGIVWVGTNSALGRIEYTMQNGGLKYKISVFTTADGLAGRQINSIAEKNDTIYAATTGGISILAASMQINNAEIPVYITGIKINNLDTVLQSEYSLNYSSNNISVTYSAADLAATTERIYEYRINNNEWITTQNENLELQQLAPGTYLLQVRALKRNGAASQIFAEVTFKISTPFWQNWIFYLIVFTVAFILLAYIIQRRSAVKRQESLQKLLTDKKLSEMELKALKAQINPHFVFNCLNSIKYLNHQKRFDETEKYLDKFSYLLRKTLDFSGLQLISLQDELRYSRNYLELEKLRLREKMKFEFIISYDIDPEKYFVPPMLFQPYLENSVKHGIRHLKNETGNIIVTIEKENAGLVCSISDDGPGIEPAKIPDTNTQGDLVPHGNTLQERRAALYGITVHTAPNKAGRGTTVTLIIKNSTH